MSNLREFERVPGLLLENWIDGLRPQGTGGKAGSSIFISGLARWSQIVTTICFSAGRSRRVNNRRKMRRGRSFTQLHP
ncbi:MAG: hypothetical protein WAZ34_05820 [Rhodocyclaceae bacterium]